MKSQHALAAKAIRADLRKAFPNIKFRVNSESYSMGNSVTVYYPANQIQPENVRSITDKYQYEPKYGVDDSCTYTKNPDLPQAMFVMVQRG